MSRVGKNRRAHNGREWKDMSRLVEIASSGTKEGQIRKAKVWVKHSCGCFQFVLEMNGVQWNADYPKHIGRCDDNETIEGNYCAEPLKRGADLFYQIKGDNDCRKNWVKPVNNLLLKWVRTDWIDVRSIRTNILQTEEIR